MAELGSLRKKILENETVLKQMVSKKARLEERLALLLRKSFAAEKKLLEQTSAKARKEEAVLNEKIASLERVTSIYDEKKKRILEAKKRQAALQGQIDKLNKQAEQWGYYG